MEFTEYTASCAAPLYFTGVCFDEKANTCMPVILVHL